MTKVIVTSPVWSLNGINLFSAQLTAGLRERGIDARILLTGVTYREKKPIPLPGDVPIEQLRIPAVATWHRRRETLRRYLEANAPCIYLPNHDFAHSCVTARLPASVGVIGIVHSDDSQHYDHFTRLGRTWNAAVAVSSRIAEKMSSLSVTTGDRLHTLPYGVRPGADRPRRNDRPLRIIYTGRLDEPQKHVSSLVRVARRLVDLGVTFQMSIVGDGPERGRLARQIERAGVGQRVALMPAVSGARVIELCAEHDVFLLPSSYEGMPLSLLEAMGQGCIPVVRMSDSGIPELITDGTNGMIVEGGDENLFAQRISELSVDRELLRRMSSAAWDTIANGRFRSDVMIAGYAALIDRVEDEMSSGQFIRDATASACPSLGLRDIVAAPLWSLRPAMRRQQSLAN